MWTGIPSTLCAETATAFGRICVISASNVMAMQSQRLAREAGLGEIFHCVNGKDPNAEKVVIGASGGTGDVGLAVAAVVPIG